MNIGIRSESWEKLCTAPNFGELSGWAWQVEEPATGWDDWSRMPLTATGAVPVPDTHRHIRRRPDMAQQTTRKKKAAPPEPRFKRGDLVRVRFCLITEIIGAETNVRRTFWQAKSGGQAAGWVVEVDLPFAPAVGLPFRTLWERLLEAHE